MPPEGGAPVLQFSMFSNCIVQVEAGLAKRCADIAPGQRHGIMGFDALDRSPIIDNLIGKVFLTYGAVQRSTKPDILACFLDGTTAEGMSDAGSDKSCLPGVPLFCP